MLHQDVTQLDIAHPCHLPKNATQFAESETFLDVAQELETILDGGIGKKRIIYCPDGVCLLLDGHKVEPKKLL